MTTLYLICGIPGSGKTTLAHQLARQHNAKIHSYDNIPNARQNSDRDGIIKKQWIEAMNADLRNGHSVVCDSTNLTSDSRKWVTQRLVSCKKVLIVKVVPMEVCLQRNKGREYEVPEHRIELARQALEPPTPDEGWDQILISRD
jgi:tRNA uridine 5-carbamoylmethylation protein Kti12